jgi:hypothetical protein
MSHFIFLLATSYLVAARVFNATFDFGQHGTSLYTIDTGYNPITAPSTGDTVTTGKTYPLKWTRTNTDLIEFKLFTTQNENYFVYMDLEFNVPQARRLATIGALQKRFHQAIIMCYC